MRNAPSLQALKLMHLMIGTAGGRMADPVRHEIRLADIRAISGMKNHDRESLTPLFEELRSVVIREGNPADDSQRVVIGGLLDHAVLDRKDPISGDTMLTWFFGRMFIEMAEKSNHWAILDRQTVFHLNSKYSVLLFQHISSLVNLNRMSEKTFSVVELRAILGIPEDKLERFSHLNDRALKPAIEEINQLSRLTLTATPKKIGRTIASVTIGWEEKPDPTAAKREMQGHSVGRKARREGKVETIAPEPAKLVAKVPFPDDKNKFKFTRWHQIALDEMPPPSRDTELVAKEFRSWCMDQNTPLNAYNIEAIFRDFCNNLQVGG